MRMRAASLVLSVLLLALVNPAPARAGLRVLDEEDVVHLTDGTEVRGTILATGPRAIVIVLAEEEKERIIPVSEVDRLERGATRAATKAYKTEPVAGLKMVTGPGSDEDTGPQPEKGAASGKGKKPGAGRPKRGPKIDKSLLAGAAKKNPRLAAWLKSMGGPEKALEWIEKNRGRSGASKMIEEFMKTGKISPGLPFKAPRR